VIDERRDDLDRPAVLAAAVDILIATHDVAGARIASEELVKIADSTRSALLRATAQLAAGSVLLADGDPASALTMLRPARDGWIALEMPHPAARTSARIGLACRDLGDEDSADMELEAARQTFQRLGAKFDLEALGTAPPGGQDQLTAREREVLRLVAAGRTNSEIATTLVISKHTVNRHVQNIFAKLGLSSRTAAAAYAYEHHLV
jgi:DNA-binding NarL/FixJ family response regulator